MEHSCKVIGFLLLPLIYCVIFSDIISSYLWFYSNFSEISFHCHLAILSRRPLSCLMNQTVENHSSSAFHLGEQTKELAPASSCPRAAEQEHSLHMPRRSPTGGPLSCITNGPISFQASSLYFSFKYSPAASSLLSDLHLIDFSGHCAEPEKLRLPGSWQKGPMKPEYYRDLHVYLSPRNCFIFEGKSRESADHSYLVNRTYMAFGGESNLKWPQTAQTEAHPLNQPDFGHGPSCWTTGTTGGGLTWAALLSSGCPVSVFQVFTGFCHLLLPIPAA